MKLSVIRPVRYIWSASDPTPSLHSATRTTSPPFLTPFRAPRESLIAWESVSS